jgi:outer membrane immunogenic protein
MKNTLLISTAILAVMSVPVHAETYGNNTSSTTYERSETTVSSVEPQAGYNHDEGTVADFTGIYAGADVGYAIGTADIDVGGVDNDLGYDGFNGDVFLGYGYEHNYNWLGSYLGIELGYELSAADGDFAGTSYEKEDAWHASLRPGFTMHQDTLGYGIIGYTRANFEGGGDDDDLSGLVVGAGAEFDTNTAFKTRLEYTYTAYEDGDLAGVDFDPSENNIKLGIFFRL